MAGQPEVFVRRLSGEEGQRLVRTAYTGRGRVPQRRAMILLASAQGRSAEAIANLIEGSVEYVREVIHAFNAHGFEALDWAQNGEDAGSLAADGIAGAVAATPWPTPAAWASRSPRSRWATVPRLEVASPSLTAVRAGNGLPAPQDSHGPAHPPAFEPPAPAHRVEPAREVGCPCSTSTGRNGMRQDDSEGGEPAGQASYERRRLSELERENARLRKDRELLKAAAAFFAAESQRTS